MFATSMVSLKYASIVLIIFMPSTKSKLRTISFQNILQQTVGQWAIAFLIIISYCIDKLKGNSNKINLRSSFFHNLS